MPLTHSMVEQLADWCLKSSDPADIRLKARSAFLEAMSRASSNIWLMAMMQPAGSRKTSGGSHRLQKGRKSRNIKFFYDAVANLG
jgi:hypothetical protein